MSRFTKVVAAFGAGSLLSVGWQLANAQTPAQMEYERQQREYRQQQEQQRQEQQRLQQLQNDNARRQQEESNGHAVIDPARPSPVPIDGGQSPSAQAVDRAGHRNIERRYAVPGHGQFVAHVPRDWKEQLRQPPNREPRRSSSAASGNAFSFCCSSCARAQGSRADTRDELRAAVGRGSQSAKALGA